MGNPRRLGKLLLSILALSLAPGPAAGEAFRIGEVEGLIDGSLAWGILTRLEERDSEFIGIGNGGLAPSVNIDDGNLNYDVGVVSNMVRATGELTLLWEMLGAYVRAFAFYDFENELFDRARTDLSDDARRMIGWDVDVLDYYLTARFKAGPVPIQVRAGNQVINWGESGFLRFGVDVVNPIDLVALGQPATTARDIFVPQGMIWASANLTEHIGVEAFYQYEWRPVRLDPVGAFFSADDLVGGDGLGDAFTGGGLFSDRGTDLNAAFDLPDGTVEAAFGLSGFDPDFMKIFGEGRNKPDSQGQFGVQIQTFFPWLNFSKVSLHFVNYHSRFPLVNGYTASPAAVAATSQAAVDARAAVLAPVYEAEGLDPGAAAAKAATTAETLTIGNFSQATSYYALHPENIQMLGMSFNTTTPGTGTLVAGEVSHHFGRPVQVPDDVVLTAALSPIGFTDEFSQTPLGAFGPNEVVKGYRRRDKTQVSLGFVQLFGPQVWSSQSLLAVDFGYVHIHGFPDDFRPFTDDSWGYRVIAGLTYDSVFGGLTMTPSIVWTHDVDGITPGPGGAFLEGRKSFTVGLGFEYASTITADLSYTMFTGGSEFNIGKDRDFLRFNVIYHF